MERNTTLWERVAALMLALFMVFSMMPLQAFATEPDPSVTPSVTIESNAAEIAVGTQSITLTASPQNMPENADISYEWSVDNPDIAHFTGETNSLNATLVRQENANGPVRVTCEAKTGGSVVASGTKTVYVKRKAQLTDVTIKQIGDPVGEIVYGKSVLTAEATGLDADRAVYTWTKADSEDKKEGKSYEPSSVGTYTVTALVPADETNGLEASYPVTATVTVKEHITDVSLNKSELSLEITAETPSPKETLTATVNPPDTEETELEWFTENATVATVDQDGTVTAVGNGTAKITVQSRVDNTLKESCQVSVTTATNSITFVNDPASPIVLRSDVEGQKTSTLEVELTPATATQDITWESDHPDIVTVTPQADNETIATIQAVNPGNAVITVRNRGKEASINVVVKAAASAVGITAPEYITASGEYSALTYKESGIQFSATTEPAAEYCTDSVVWSVAPSDKGVSIDQTGKLTIDEGGLSDDSVPVTVTAKAGNTEETFVLTFKKVEDVPVIAAVGTKDQVVYGNNIPQLTAESRTDVTFELVVDDAHQNTAYAVVASDGNVTYDTVGAFTVRAKSQGNGFYQSKLSEVKTIEITPKPVTVTYTAPASIGKSSDGTKDLTSKNKEDLQNAFQFAEGMVLTSDADKVTLVVDVSGASYVSTDIGTNKNKILLNSVRLSLNGDRAVNYCFENADQDSTIAATAFMNGVTDCTATITAKTPQGTSHIDMTAASQDVAVEDGIMTLTAGTLSSCQENSYWYRFDSNGVVPVTLAEKWTLLKGTDERGTDGNALTGNKLPADSSGKPLYLCQTSSDSNSLYIGPYYVQFQYDATPPVVTVKNVDGNEQSDTITFDKNAVYTVTIEDDESGVDVETLEYGVASTTPEDDAWTRVTGLTKNTEDQYEFKVEVSGADTLFVRVKDMVGNQGEDDFKTLVLENDAPTVSLTVNGSSVENNSTVPDYIQNYTFDITVNEPVGDQVTQQSGIKTVRYTIEQQNVPEGTPANKTAETILNNVASELKSVDQIEGEYLTKTLSGYSVKDLFENDETAISAQLDGEYLLTITATDFCGNSSTFLYTFKFDNTAPVVKAAMTDAVDKNGESYYYRADNGGLKVTFEDDHLGDTVNGVSGTYTVTVSGDSSSLQTKSLEAGEDSISFSAAEIAGLPDGTITVTVVAKDAAGNEATDFDSVDGAAASGRTFSFVLDKTAPRLTSVSSTGGNYYETENKVYYNNDFTVTFVVEETNYDANCVQLANGNTEVQTGIPEMLLSKNQQNAITVSVARADQVANALYQPQLTVTDKAGNAMVAQTDLAESGQNGVSVSEGKATTTATFVLDTVAPKLEAVSSTGGNDYTGSENKVYYNEAFAVAFQVEETNYDPNRVQLANAIADAQNESSTMSLSADDQKNIAVSVSGTAANALYQPQLTVTDKAGNKMAAGENLATSGRNGVAVDSDNGEATTTATFVLDTVKPKLEAVSSTGGNDYTGSENKVYYNKAFAVAFQVEETNYDPNRVQLANGIEEAQNESSTMSLSADDQKNIAVSVSGTAANALYQPQLTVTDKAGNAMAAGENLATSGRNGVAVDSDNGEATTTATFVLDTVKPKLQSVSTTKNGNAYAEGVYYQDGFDATFTIEEINYDNAQNGAMGKSVLSIKKDNAESHAASMDTRSTVGTTHAVKATVSRAETPKTVYSIALTVTDKAGNPLTATENAPYNSEDASSQIHTTVDENGTATLKNRIMDNVAPEVEIEYTALEATHYYKESDDAAATAYYNKDLETTFTFNDVGSLDENKLCFARTYEGAQDVFAPFGTGVGTDEQRTFNGTTNAKFKIGTNPEDNGIYTYTIYGEDKAGNLLNVTELHYYVNDNEGQNHQLGCGVGSPYTTAPKAMDTVSPTATITYTPLKETHYYPEGETQVNAYYNKNFDAKFQFADTYGNGESTFGVDPAKLRYTQNITAEQDKVLPSDDTLEVSYSVTGTSEGDHYTFGAYGEDKAGNPLNVTENSTTSPTASNPYTAASQEAQQLNYHKVLDTVAPVATFQIVPAAKPAHPEMQTLGGQKRFYLNTQFTATYSIDEINYDNSKVKAWYGHSNPEDYLNSSVSADTSATANNGFSAPDKIRSFTSTLDGLYSFTLTGEDRAGNQITAGGQGTTLAGNPLESIENNKLTSYIITVDTVSPVLQAGIGDYYEAALRENAYSVSKNSPYRNERSTTLTLTATDPSPKVIRYATTSTLGDSADGDLNALDSYNQGGSVLSLTKDFSGEQVFAITELVVADLAGNVSTAPANVDGNVSNYIYLDVTPPTEDKLAPTVSLVAHESGQGRSVQGVDLYNSTVTVEAKISDPGFGEGTHGTGGTSSGLFTLHYVVQHNDSENWNAQMEGKVATTSTNHGITTGADGIVYYTESKKGDEYTSIDPGVANEALVGEDTITFTFDAATFNYNDISIRVWAEDNTGHKSGEAIYRFGIDTTAPKIQVTYDNNDARNEKYFKADRTATVVVTERNFDPDNTVITTEVGHSGWSYAAGGLANGDDDTWTCTVPYTEDADYTFNVTAKDLVGHDAGEADYGDSVAPREFTVDKTKPVIEITFDNNDVRNGRYYKENRTATIHIEEHNFAAEDAEVTTTAEIAEGGVAAPAAGSWGSAGDSNTAQVPFNADGDYTMQVKFQDKAGNEAEPKEVELFTVDTTAPELTFSINDEAFEAGSYTPRAYNGQVVPGITYHDINYDGTGTQMSIVGAKNVNSQILSGAPAEDAMGGVYTCENIAETPENDDVYTCTGRVVDMAGNESTVDFLFSVNRYGSNYLLTPDTQALVDNYYTNSAPNLGVSEINVNTLKFEEITYALNGDIRTLQPGTDYQVTESGSETSWKQYDYTIFNSNFDREGVYDITIYSEDEAGNANSNHTERVKEYSKNISFVLDQTAPSITISGVDEGGIYDTDTRSVTVAYGENFAMDNLIITNGEKTETYTAEQLQATGGTLEFVVPASREKQSVKVTAADKAGNIATIESPRFVLSSSLFVRWVNNTPVMVGTISFGVLAVAAVADYLRKGFLFALLHKHTGVKH